jgi:ferredoxin
MIAYLGYKDGSGEWFLRLDTEKCNGCGACVEVCPSEALEVGPDEADPLRDEPVMTVKSTERKKLKYTCAPCKPEYGDTPAPCKAACAAGAISHLEAWKNMFA